MTTPAGAFPAPRRSSRARWLAAGCALLMCLGFLALGTWQLFRLQWKLALIERVEQRVHAAPAPAPARPAWAAVSREQDEYRHLRLQGHYLAGADALVQATTDYGSGFWLLSPFCSSDGNIVFVNRGFVAASRPKPQLAPGASCAAAPPTDTVSGLLRLSEPGGGYLRKNDASAERWFSRDVAALGTARGLAPVAPFFVDAEAVSAAAAEQARAGAGSSEPVPGLTVLSFSNNHLVYALTWYGLALLAAIAGWLLRHEGGTGKARP